MTKKNSYVTDALLDRARIERIEQWLADARWHQHPTNYVTCQHPIILNVNNGQNIDNSTNACVNSVIDESLNADCSSETLQLDASCSSSTDFTPFEFSCHNPSVKQYSNHLSTRLVSKHCAHQNNNSAKRFNVSDQWHENSRKMLPPINGPYVARIHVEATRAPPISRQRLAPTSGLRQYNMLDDITPTSPRMKLMTLSNSFDQRYRDGTIVMSPESAPDINQIRRYAATNEQQYIVPADITRKRHVTIVTVTSDASDRRTSPSTSSGYRRRHGVLTVTINKHSAADSTDMLMSTHTESNPRHDLYNSQCTDNIDDVIDSGRQDSKQTLVSSSAMTSEKSSTSVNGGEPVTRLGVISERCVVTVQQETLAECQLIDDVEATADDNRHQESDAINCLSLQESLGGYDLIIVSEQDDHDVVSPQLDTANGQFDESLISCRSYVSTATLILSCTTPVVNCMRKIVSTRLETSSQHG